MLGPVLDLAAIGLVNGAWRNTCVGTWHVQGRMRDGDMLRVNSHTTWQVPAGDRGRQGCRSAAAAPPQQECRNRSWRLDEPLSVQTGVMQGVQEGGQLAVCRTYPDPDAVGVVVW